MYEKRHSHCEDDKSATVIQLKQTKTKLDITTGIFTHEWLKAAVAKAKHTWSANATREQVQEYTGVITRLTKSIAKQLCSHAEL